jgi:hypothetical protein
MLLSTNILTAQTPRMRNRKGLYRVCVEKRKGKRTLVRPSCGRGDNIKRNFQKVVFWDTDWIDMTQDRDR